MVNISQSQILAVMPSATLKNADAYAVTLSEAMNRFRINTPARIAAFLAQIAHESGSLSRVVENLNYSADGLAATWPGRYRAPSNQPNETARRLHRKPEAIANHCYAGRMGNGDEASGDGWKYRGRGLIQITGRENYKKCGDGLGLDYMSVPELMEWPQHAALSAAWFWASRNLNELADVGDFLSITRKINGGTNGLTDRRAYWARAKSVFKVQGA